MFTNQKGCTIWERITVNHAPAYVRHEEGALYWENTDAQEIRAGADIVRTPKNGALILIPAKSVKYLPKKDDRIVADICPDESPPKNAMTIMSVKDYLYASRRSAHIEVTAS